MNPSDELRIIELRLESDKKGTLWCNCENPDREIVSELLTAGDILTSADSLNCSLVFLASCEAGQGALNTYLDESAGLPAALVESGISSIISPLWQLPGEICLLYVDKFYQSLFERKGKRRLSEIVSSANDKMRQIKKSDVIAWIDNLRYNIKDGTVRFRLEAWKNNLASMPNYPYMDPYYSSAFFVTGGNRIVVE